MAKSGRRDGGVAKRLHPHAGGHDDDSESRLTRTLHQHAYLKSASLGIFTTKFTKKKTATSFCYLRARRVLRGKVIISVSNWGFPDNQVHEIFSGA